MADHDRDQQVRDAFDRALGSAAGETPCDIYRANASNAGSLGDAIQSHFGAPAKAFYDALVQIAQSSCG